MRIFGWLGDVGACGFYRIILPLGAMRGLDGVRETWWSNKIDHAENPGWEADVVVAQRSHLAGPTEILKRIYKSKGDRPFLVYELDDDLWHIDKTNKAAYRYHMIENPGARANMVECIRHVDLVTVTTEPLAEVVRRWNPNVAVIPNYVPAELLRWRPGGYDDRLTLGWQGSQTHDGDWKGEPAVGLRRWFNKRKLANQKVEVHVMGNVPTSFPDVYPFRQTPWTPSIDAFYRTIDWDIALAPLADSRFNRSKSYLRILEAAALGIPVVASDVPAYREILDQHRFGFTADTVNDWCEALDALTEQNVREECARLGRQFAAANTIEGNAWRWLEVYK